MSITILPEFAIAFALVFARVGTMMMLIPGLGERAAPARVRLVLAVMVTMITLPIVRAGMPTSLANLPAIVNLLVVDRPFAPGPPHNRQVGGRKRRSSAASPAAIMDSLAR